MKRLFRSSLLLVPRREAIVTLDASEISDILRAMPPTDVFGALANPVRRRILELLRENPRSAGEIAAEFALQRPAVSEHLQVLRNARLVTEEARGRLRIYRLEPAALAEVGDWLRPFEDYWRGRMRALRETLDEEPS
jgi:DNA-binding transcriptional ArsR family regulator